MGDYSCNEHGKNYVEGCVACDFPREFEELKRQLAEKDQQLIELDHCRKMASRVEDIERQLAEARTNKERYLYWRDVERGGGICISDAPLDYLCGDELDEYTDKQKSKRQKLEANGWKFGSAKEFLESSDE